MKARRTTRLIVASAFITVTAAPLIAQDAASSPAPQVRSSNPRIREVLADAVQRSPLLADLVAALNRRDRIVYIEEGRCPNREQRSCLQLMPTPGGQHLWVRIDPRRLDRTVVAQLAHELYHALEVADAPGVVDAVSFKALYDRIGARTCTRQDHACWETSAAVQFETSVRRQISGALPAASRVPSK